MIETTAVNEDLLDVARRMRGVDRCEILAVMPHLSLLEWVEWMSSMPGLFEVAWDAGARVAVCGAVIVAPHLATTWMVGTKGLDWPAARVATHRAALRLHRRIDAAGVRRCTASPWAGNEQARKWLERLGYRLEGHHPGMGVGDLCDFVTYGRVHGH